MPSASRSRFRWLAWIVAVLGLVFVGLQFVRPELSNPPVVAEVQVPAEVREVLKRSCYSCHSNETKLPWFDRIVPAYWLVARDVQQARRHLNFSEIGRLPAGAQRGFLFEAVNQIQMGAMPLPAYVRVHPGAAVTQEQLSVLRNYLLPSAAPMGAAADAAGASAADAQYVGWIQANSSQTSSVPPPVQPEFNGIAFVSDYRNWKAISSTDRLDNGTIRVILGNDVAVKAIAENHINSWPDGTVFAKVAWLKSQPDENGVVKTGAFFQVEFMIKDARKYASTEGWGWGRWRGADLKPYGKDAEFQNECTNCHAPLRRNDYVYTEPINIGEMSGRGQ